MNNTKTSLKDKWNDAPQLLKVIIYGALIAVVIYVFFLAFMPNKYETLYTGLEVQDSLDIQQNLSTKGVDYTLSEDGSTIMVDGDVILIKRDLALQNLPQGGTTGGLSKFDELSIGSTKFDKEVQYQNRLQEEIQNSIVKAFETVSSANVKLPRIKEKSIFDQDGEPVKISVAIKTRNNDMMSRENVRAIQVFVAGSIQEVRAEDVEVVDSQMNVLSGIDEEGTFGAGSGKQMQIANETKAQIEKELTNVLGEVYGKVRVIANVDINFDEIVQNIEKYDPEGTILSREENLEATREVERATLGEVGTDQNGEVPRYEIADLDENDALYAQDKENLIENFAVGKTVEKIIKHPELRNTNVAVWVDSNLNNAEIMELEEMISISSGMTGQAMRDANEKAIYNNGSVKVTQREFALVEEMEEIFEEDPGFVIPWWYYAIAAGIVLLLLAIIIFLILRARKRKREMLRALEEQENLEAQEKLRKSQERTNQELNIEIGDGYESVNEAKDKFKFEWTNKQTGLRDATNDVSNKFPKETADVIKKFLRESE